MCYYSNELDQRLLYLPRPLALFRGTAAWEHYFEICVLPVCYCAVTKIVIFHDWVVISLPNFMWTPIACSLGATF